MAAVDISGKSTQSVGGIDYGGFNFSPQKGISQQQLLIYAGLGLLVFFIIKKIGKKGAK